MILTNISHVFKGKVMYYQYIPHFQWQVLRADKLYSELLHEHNILFQKLTGILDAAAQHREH